MPLTPARRLWLGLHCAEFGMRARAPPDVAPGPRAGRGAADPVSGKASPAERKPKPGGTKPKPGGTISKSAGTKSKSGGTKSKFFGTNPNEFSSANLGFSRGYHGLGRKKAFAAPVPGQRPPRTRHTPSVEPDRRRRPLPPHVRFWSRSSQANYREFRFSARICWLSWRLVLIRAILGASDSRRRWWRARNLRTGWAGSVG